MDSRLGRCHVAASRHVIVLGLLICAGAAVILSACGPTATTLSQATLIRRDTTKTFPANSPDNVQVTSQCQRGEQPVSGGYSLIYNLAEPEYVAPYIWASYPSDPNGTASSRPTAWTVLVSPPRSGGAITATAECLKAPFALSLQAAMATTTTSETQLAYTVQATCPAGTLLSGGGFKPDEGFLEWSPDRMGMDGSYPSKISAWTVKGIAGETKAGPVIGTMTAYALCLTAAQLQQAPAVQQLLIIAPSLAPNTCGSNACWADNQVSVTLACPVGALLVGGGFSELAPDYSQRDISFGGEQISLVTEAATANGSSWLTQVRTAQSVLPGKPGAAAKMNMWAVCLASAGNSAGNGGATGAPTAMPSATPSDTPTLALTPTSAPAIKPTLTPTAKAAPPRLGVSPTGEVDVNCGSLPLTYPPVTVRNSGDGTLTWQVMATNTHVTVIPASGNLSAGQSQTLSVTQTSGSAGTELKFGSNAGSVTISFVCIPG